jgi:hypothetical protein
MKKLSVVVCTLVWIIRQGLKLRKYFRGQVGPHQLRLKGSGCHYNSIYNNTGTK